MGTGTALQETAAVDVKITKIVKWVAAYGDPPLWTLRFLLGNEEYEVSLLSTYDLMSRAKVREHIAEKCNRMACLGKQLNWERALGDAMKDDRLQIEQVPVEATFPQQVLVGLTEFVKDVGGVPDVDYDRFMLERRIGKRGSERAEQWRVGTGRQLFDDESLLIAYIWLEAETRLVWFIPYRLREFLMATRITSRSLTAVWRALTHFGVQECKDMVVLGKPLTVWSVPRDVLDLPEALWPSSV